MPLQNVFRNPKFWRTFLDGTHYSYDDIPDLTGKVAIVTGATGSVGYATVVALAAHGAHVFLACRNRVMAEEAIERAQNQPKLEFLELELGEMRKAQSAAREFLDKGLPLHILVCSAGIKFRNFELTEDGFENHFGINHLGHFVFTTALLERIRESAPARIVILSSMAHEVPPSNKPIDFKSLRDEKNRTNAVMRYGQSKLANVLFAKALARRLRNDRVWVNIAHPGNVESHIRQDMLESDNKTFRAFCCLWLLLAYKARDAALTPLYLATSPEVVEKNIRGMYFIPIANEMDPSPISDSVNLQEELWRYSEKASQGGSKV
ncbi:hypothetical protein B0O80DRAFT_393279 [Mortierella sp. GBAus27b]|nr:hypothetical protein B0O80DRAFT_393279 [Mortierella sp. GBAus27b]